MTRAGTSRASSIDLRTVFAQLADQVGQLGMSLELWDSSLAPMGRFEPRCGLCAPGSDCQGRCLDAMGKAARDAIEGRKPQQCSTSWGCCVLAVPLRRRRRLIGVASMCYPPRELLEEETFHRFCSQVELDCCAARETALKACQHSRSEAKGLLQVLDDMAQREQDLRVAQDALGNLSANLATTYEELSLLYRISGSMRVTQRPEDFLARTCRELLDVANISAAVAMIDSRAHSEEEDITVIEGHINADKETIREILTGSVAPKLAKGSRAVLANDFAADNPIACGPDGPPLIRNLIAVPLVAEEKAIGILVGINKANADFDSVDEKLFNSIANQAAVFLSNNRLYAELQDLLMGVLYALTESIDAKDPYTHGHSQRVALVSKRLAEECGFDEAKAQRVYLSGLLHDIGKIGVSEAVLVKEGRLTEQEYEKVKRHPSTGAKILGGIHHLEDVIDGMLAHHERPDGMGYPFGLRGDEIPIEGLIVGLADAFDAMTSHRTYRNALPLQAAVAEIEKHAGTQFDQSLVEKFLLIDHEELMEEMHSPVKAAFTVSIAHDGR